MTMACKTGKHFWLDHDSALFCCNGYHRELRSRDDLLGAEDRGTVKVAGTALLSVWVRDAEPTASTYGTNTDSAGTEQ